LIRFGCARKLSVELFLSVVPYCGRQDCECVLYVRGAGGGVLKLYTEFSGVLFVYYLRLTGEWWVFLLLEEEEGEEEFLTVVGLLLHTQQQCPVNTSRGVHQQHQL